MVYYLMTTEQMNAYYKANAYKMEERINAREMVKANHSAVATASSLDARKIPDFFRLYDAYEKEVAKVMDPLYSERNAKVGEVLNHCPTLISKTKKACCEEGARIAEAMGCEECHILNVTFSKDKVNKYSTVPNSVYRAQYWYLYKDEGKWFQKMQKSCKARHEINL